MNLQPRREEIIGTSEILHTTQGAVFKVGGITLDAAAFPEGIVKAGTAVSIGANGLAKPWADADTGLAYLTVHDEANRKNGNIVTGALEAGFVQTAKLTGVTDAFRTAVQGRIHFR